MESLFSPDDTLSSLSVLLTISSVLHDSASTRMASLDSASFDSSFSNYCSISATIRHYSSLFISDMNSRLLSSPISFISVALYKFSGSLDSSPKTTSSSFFWSLFSSI